MKIEFVNHASYIFHYDEISLICDPWIEGRVFHESWSLLTPSKFTFQDFSRITHIWFSHEHPDHFFPPNLKAIPEKFRKNIVVLYHETGDKKVIKFCQSLGFKGVIELKQGEKFKLTEKISLLNNPVGDDSWLLIETDKHKILNVNDCDLGKGKKLSEAAHLTGEVDVLLTQFSYANKQGNIDEPEKRIAAADHKLELMGFQFKAFKPKYVIPFASFVWFSHIDNFYMNDGINKIDKVERFIADKGFTPVVLYPSDTFNFNESWNNKEAISLYMKDYEQISIENASPLKSVDMQTIEATFQKFWAKLKERSSVYRILLGLFPLRVYIHDLNKSLEFKQGKVIFKGFTSEDAHMITSSETINYCFQFNWGFNTTMVNARYQVNSPLYLRMRLYKNVCDSLNHDNSMFKRVLHKLGL